MISGLYDFFQFMALLFFLPKWGLSAILRRDHRVLNYLGLFLPKAKSSEGLRFLVYAVSVGEVKAIAHLFTLMQETYPTASFYVACRTMTGLEEAKRTLPAADSHFLLPVDLSFLSKKLIHCIRPHAVLIVEGDLWYNLLQAAQKNGALTCLISGKISLRSYQRFSSFPSLSKRLFSLLSLVCAQNKIYAERFIHLGCKAASVFVTGNIKLEVKKELLSAQDLELFKQKLGIKAEDFIVVVGSTHAPEEENILKSLEPLWSCFPQLKCVLVPRHPERFQEVKKLLSSSKVPSISLSNLSAKTGQERILLIDAMGLLFDLYQIAHLSIVGGSFSPSLKGHNIIEPIQAKSPCFFGPYMENQNDLVDLVLSFHAGAQIDCFQIASIVQKAIEESSFLSDFKKQGEMLLLHLRDGSSRSWDCLYSELKKSAHF